LKDIDTLKSCELVKYTIQEFFNNGNADKIASNCDLPITIEDVTYTTKNSLVEFFSNVIKSASASKSNPKTVKTFVLGRRQELLNGFIKIDILYIVGVIQFNINGQLPEKMTIFGIRNPVNPTIVGMHVE
jgi:hypothetical protein